MLKKVAIVITLLFAGILLFAASKPDSFRVQRSATIKAPPEKIFPLINDLHNWTVWSPYEKKDPAMRRTHSGAASGKGAVYEWDGNGEVGKGRMEIVESAAPAKILIDLKFLEPFAANHVAEFVLKPQGDVTEVTWAMYGPAHFVSKVVQIFIDMDRMVGNDFASGLANLKAIAEK